MMRLSRMAVGALAAVMLLAGCRTVQGAEPVPTEQTLDPARAATMVAGLPTVVRETPTPSATAAPDSPTAEPEPFDGWRIDDLAARDYGGSGIVLGNVTGEEFSFTQYAMQYESDGLTVTGLANVPTGEGPFPVIVVNHGYATFENYTPGYDSRDVAASLARRGYLALMPDYRNYGGSDEGPNPFQIGYAIDVMNLIAQVGSLPKADPDRIGVFGHSMGGGVSQWPMVLQGGTVDAVVLYAAMTGDIATSYQHVDTMWPWWDQSDADPAVFGTPEANPAGYAAASPTSHLDRVTMPVMIHHGSDDEQVPYDWSVALWRGLQAEEKVVQFYEYEGAGHDFTGDTFVQMLTRTITFFDRFVRDGEPIPPPG